MFHDFLFEVNGAAVDKKIISLNSSVHFVNVKEGTFNIYKNGEKKSVSNPIERKEFPFFTIDNEKLTFHELVDLDEENFVIKQSEELVFRESATISIDDYKGFYFKNDTMIQKSFLETIDFPFVLNNTYYTLRLLDDNLFSYYNIEEIQIDESVTQINLGFKLIYKDDKEIKIFDGVVGTDLFPFIRENTKYELKVVVVTEEIVVKIKSDLLTFSYLLQGIIYSKGIKHSINNFLSQNLFPFLFNDRKYILEKIDPSKFTHRKTKSIEHYRLETEIFTNFTHENIDVYYTDGTTKKLHVNNGRISKSDFPFIFENVLYTLMELSDTDSPSYNKEDMIQVEYNSTSPVRIEINGQWVYSNGLWTNQLDELVSSGGFPLIFQETKYTIVYLLETSNIISIKKVTILKASEYAETDIDPGEIQIHRNGLDELILVGERGSINRNFFPFVHKNIQYVLDEIISSEYLVKSEKTFNCYYGEKTVDIGTSGTINTFYENKSKEIENSSEISLSFFPFIYRNVLYKIQNVPDLTRSGLKVIEINSGEYDLVDYIKISNVEIIQRLDRKIFRVVNLLQKGYIETKREFIVLYER